MRRKLRWADSLHRLLVSLQETPARMVALSFLGLITAGTFLLMLDRSTVGPGGCSLVDAVFTATSAACVTGLIVEDTATYFTTFGQVVILALIQLGGLGIMTLSVALGSIFGRRITLRQRQEVRDIMDLTLTQQVRRILRIVVLATLAIEAVGAALLFLCFLPHYPSATRALASACFHSISAFCNAGFSIHSDSLVGFAANLPVNAVVMVLIVLGGLGFVALTNLWETRVRREPGSRLSLQTRLVLITSGVCIVLGTVLFWVTEHYRSLEGQSFVRGWLMALFQSVTARTAGFNTVDIGQLAPSTRFVLILLMMVGASPGSTGGGLKTTTVAIAVGSVIAAFRNREEVVFFRRQVRAETVRRALTLLVLYVFFMNVSLFALVETHTFAFSDGVFEVASALGTVGLSTGITPELSSSGRLLISLVMFVGRLGPLTLAVALTTHHRRVTVQYAEENVVVG